MLDLRTGKEMTRRETIKGGLGLAAILAAGKAPAMLLGARGVAFGESLPYDEELEYLESNGNQYIALGGNYIGYGHTLEQYIDVQLLSDDRTRSVVSGINNTLYLGPSDQYHDHWGANYADETRRFVIDYSNFQHFYHKSLGLATRTWTLGIERYNGYSYSNGHSYLNGAIGLFAIGNGDQTYLADRAICRVKKYMFWYDGNLVLNLTPILKNSVPCMFDAVSGICYFNSLSGHQFGYKKNDGTIVNPT